jgi:hypothetical protein
VDTDAKLMVLLNWYHKPDGRNLSGNYNKSKKRALDKQIQKHIQEAVLLKEKYFLNKENYELYS